MIQWCDISCATLYISPFLLIFSSFHNVSWSEKLMHNSRLKMHSGISLYSQLISATVDDLKFDACSILLPSIQVLS